ncbi:unnamed protein product [Strongylus vulgaris]|uniref:WH2 domain-containing protein n=1 Tax=Strongylus vulgaris TaxID=40348 RepID=A0A3P7IKF1_STRVU|nr:unnamed protein product [Strongylus vulgaris]
MNECLLLFNDSLHSCSLRELSPHIKDLSGATGAHEDDTENLLVTVDLKRVVDPLDYVPEAGPLEDLDLPNILPDLPGIAEDLTLPDFDVVLPAVFSDTHQSTVEPDILKDLETVGSNASNSASDVSKPDKNDAKDEKEPSGVADVIVDVRSLPTLKEVQSAPAVTSVPPPPPPPPPPPLLLSPAPAPVPQSSLPQTNDRADLMAAIRAAGGAGKAKLKSIGSQRRSVKESESLSSSALSEKSSSPGNSLMMSLAKALEARRKAISGMNPSSNSTGLETSRGVDEGRKSDGDDDWK